MQSARPPLYLDESADSKVLRAILRNPSHGFVVLVPRDVGMAGKSDFEQLKFAAEHALLMVTKNPHDFKRLHDRNPNHSGIVAIYRDNSVRDMSDHEVADALVALVDSGAPIQGEFHNLVYWKIPSSR